MLLPAIAMSLVHAAPAASPPPARSYEAVLSDSTRIEGERLVGWHEHPGAPRLGNTALLDARRPLLWLRDRTLGPWSPPEHCTGYIEFFGGDRIVGSIVGAQARREYDGVHTPAHLLVKPATELHVPSQHQLPPYLRIRSEHIRRVVFRPPSRRRFQGGNLFYVDGRRVGFVSLSWRQESVVLLLSSGTRTVKLLDIAEIHVPTINPWQGYYRELAVLSPACRSRLVRIETTAGLIATASDMRFDAIPFPSAAHKQQAVERLKQLDALLARVAGEHKAAEQKLRTAHGDYAKQSTALKEETKRSQEAFQKAKGEIQQRVDKDRKSDAAGLAKKREKLDRDFRSAMSAMENRLAKQTPKQREEMLKAFRQRQDQLHKQQEKLLDNEAQRYQQQRQREFDQAIRREEQKYKTQEYSRRNKPNQLKSKLDEETRRCEQHSRYFEQVKAQRASAPGKDGNVDTWYHMVQPVWSLDSLWAPFRSIYMRCSLPPAHVPLSRIHPSAAVSPSLLPWHVNRNSAALPLSSGRRQYSWGFAVHAYSELSFVLPHAARAFRTRLGLDSMVDKGGCVRARVFAGSTRSKPLYESPLLIGSEKTVDTGSIALRPDPDGSLRLILQVDPVNRNSPPGADPLNVRDKLDWLDPQIELDFQTLQAAVRRQVVEETFAWKGWTLRFDKGGLYTWSSFYDKTAGRHRGSFLPMVRAERKPLTLSRTLTVGAKDNWLVVNTAGLSDGVLGPRAVSFRVDRKETPPEKIPQKQEWQEQDPPQVFSLSPYRGKKVTLELTQAADGKPVHWKTAKIAEAPPAAYRLSRMLKLAGKGDLQIPRGLGWALRSGGIDERGKLALLDIHQLRGVVNFGMSGLPGMAPDELNNLLIGADWTGGDKAFVTKLGKLSGLKTLFLAGDAGISPAAVEKLQAQMPRLTIVRFERTPSPISAPCFMTMHNRTGRDVVVFWIGYTGKLSHSRTIKPNEQRKQRTHVGGRYEAYLDGKLISRCVVVPDHVWEIKQEKPRPGP